MTYRQYFSRGANEKRVNYNLLLCTAFNKKVLSNKNFFEAPRRKNTVLSYKMIHDTGNPGEVIVNYSKKENGTTIVMGCRGLGKLRRTLLGSVGHQRTVKS